MAREAEAERRGGRRGVGVGVAVAEEVVVVVVPGGGGGEREAEAVACDEAGLHGGGGGVKISRRWEEEIRLGSQAAHLTTRQSWLAAEDLEERERDMRIIGLIFS